MQPHHVSSFRDFASYSVGTYSIDLFPVEQSDGFSESIMSSNTSSLSSPPSSIAVKATQVYEMTHQSQPGPPYHPLNPTTRPIYTQLIDMCLTCGYTHDQVITPRYHAFELAAMVHHALESWTRFPPAESPEVMRVLAAGGTYAAMGADRMQLMRDKIEVEKSCAQRGWTPALLAKQEQIVKALAELDKTRPVPLVAQRRPHPLKSPSWEFFKILQAKTATVKTQLSVFEIQELVNQFHGTRSKSEVKKSTATTTTTSSTSVPSSAAAAAASAFSSCGELTGKKRKIEESPVIGVDVSSSDDSESSKREAALVIENQSLKEQLKAKDQQIERMMQLLTK